MILFAGVRNVEHVGLERSEEAESETKMKSGQRDRETKSKRVTNALNACVITVQYACLLRSLHLPTILLLSLLPCFSPSESESDSGTRVVSGFFGVICID